MDTSSAITTIEKWLTRSPCLIVIAGKTCSGKSTFVDLLHRRYPEDSVVVNQDNYFKDIDDPLLPKSDGYRIFDDPGAYHKDQFVSDVGNLLKGFVVFAPIYDIAKNKRTTQQEVLTPRSIIIAEGLFAIDFLQEYEPRLSIYFEADTATLLQRRIARDITFGVPENTIRRFFFSQVLPRQNKHVEPQRRLADLIVSTS